MCLSLPSAPTRFSLLFLEELFSLLFRVEDESLLLLDVEDSLLLRDEDDPLELWLSFVDVDTRESLSLLLFVRDVRLLEVFSLEDKESCQRDDFFFVTNPAEYISTHSGIVTGSSPVILMKSLVSSIHA